MGLRAAELLDYAFSLGTLEHFPFSLGNIEYLLEYFSHTQGSIISRFYAAVHTFYIPFWNKELDPYYFWL